MLWVEPLKVLDHKGNSSSNLKKKVWSKHKTDTCLFLEDVDILLVHYDYPDNKVSELRLIANWTFVDVSVEGRESQRIEESQTTTEVECLFVHQPNVHSMCG